METTNKKSLTEYSDQELFMKNHRKHHHQVAVMRIFIFSFFLGIWEISANLKWLDPFFFASPSRVLLCFWGLLTDGSLLSHTFITLTETVISFLLVFLISLLAATLLWYSPKASEVFEPYLVILNSLPKSALAPLFIVWLGTGMKTIIVAGLSVAIFGSIISFYTGFKQVDPEKITIRVVDEGPGIPDLEKAMTEGWSTASNEVRNLVFGAGMGLPNMKRNADAFDIKSEVGVGTDITMIFNI